MVKENEGILTGPNEPLDKINSVGPTEPKENNKTVTNLRPNNTLPRTTGPNVDVSKDYQVSALITSGQSPYIEKTEQVTMEIINNSELVQAGVKTPKGRGEEHLSDPPNTGSKMDMDDQSDLMLANMQVDFPSQQDKTSNSTIC